MKRNEFREFLLEKSIKRVQVVTTPDYRGGNRLFILLDEQCEEYEPCDFEYIEYDGDVTQVLRDRRLEFYEHEEPFHEEPRDYPYSLEELIVMAFEE